MQFRVVYWTGSVDITTKTFDKPNDFGYSRLNEHLSGIQTNDPDNEAALLEMCDKISDAVLEYQKKVNNV